MASTNQSPFYKKAESEFLQATTNEEKIACLDIMIKECPKHKSAENMLANLKTRRKKLKQALEKSKKSGGRGGNKGIKKSDMQAVIIGFPNTGKSTIFNLLTNKNPESKISPHPFTTYIPILGTTEFENTKIQIIDSPPFPNHDKSLTNSTDTLLLVIDNIEQIKQAEKFLEKSKAKQIVIFNKSDLLNEKNKQKLESTLNSKKINAVIFSSKANQQDIKELKQKIFQTFPIIRIYTKEPKKQATKEPMILKQNSTVKDVAEKILKGMSQKIKQTKIWGPSSKFSGQVVGIEHKLKDRDTIEFQTK